MDSAPIRKKPGRIAQFLGIMAALVMGSSPASALEQQEPMQVAVLGRFAKGPVGSPISVNLAQFDQTFGSSAAVDWPAEVQARRFFAQGGTTLHVIRASPDGALGAALEGSAAAMTGRHALPLIRDLGIVICPEITILSGLEGMAYLSVWKTYMEQLKAMAILDPPPGLTTSAQAINWKNGMLPASPREFVLYYPYLLVTINGVQRSVGASGAMAALWLQNDSSAGPWKSPAGASYLLSVDGFSNYFTDQEFDALNQASIASLRRVTGNPTRYIPWGARHLNGSDPENRYISTQRLDQWISTNLTRMGTLSANRTNNTALWNEIRDNAQGLLLRCYGRGAFPGGTGTPANQVYYARCGLNVTMTQLDVLEGRVILEYGIALTTPNEFVIRKISWFTADAGPPIPAPRLLLREGASGKQLFQFTNAGASHLLRTSTTLATGGWADVGTAVNGDNTWRKTLFSTSEPKRFYRAEQTPLPTQ